MSHSTSATPKHDSSTAKSRHGFSLAALFVLVTASAVVIAGAAPLVRDFENRDLDAAAVLGCMAAGLTVGFLLGLTIGVHHYHRSRGILCGIGTGSVLGLMVGPMCLLRPNELGAVALAMFVGSVLIVFVAAFGRKRG